MNEFQRAGGLARALARPRSDRARRKRRHRAGRANDLARDLGIALTDLGEKYPLKKHLGQMALPALEASLSRWPDDVPAWHAKG